MLQAGNNIGNIAVNAFGLTNDLFFRGNTKFDLKNLSPVYRGGLIDKLFGGSFGPYAPMLQENQEMEYLSNGVKTSDYTPNLFSHETHHLWQSRALGDSFFSHYLASSVFAPFFPIDYGAFRKESYSFWQKGKERFGAMFYIFNYYESVGYNNAWWN